MKKVRKLVLIFAAALLMGVSLAYYDYEDVNARKGLQCGRRCCQNHPTNPVNCQDCCDPCCISSQNPKQCGEVCYSLCINCP